MECVISLCAAEAAAGSAAAAFHRLFPRQRELRRECLAAVPLRAEVKELAVRQAAEGCTHSGVPPRGRLPLLLWMTARACSPVCPVRSERCYWQSMRHQTCSASLCTLPQLPPLAGQFTERYPKRPSAPGAGMSPSLPVVALLPPFGVVICYVPTEPGCSTLQTAHTVLPALAVKPAQSFQDGGSRWCMAGPALECRQCRAALPASAC